MLEGDGFDRTADVGQTGDGRKSDVTDGKEIREEKQARPSLGLKWVTR